jgi:hypothetical protein
MATTPTTPQADTRNALCAIQEHPVYKQILADSFGGIMYNLANCNKYETAELLELWNSLPSSMQEAGGGIMRGAMNFIKEA